MNKIKIISLSITFLLNIISVKSMEQDFKIQPEFLSDKLKQIINKKTDKIQTKKLRNAIKTDNYNVAEDALIKGASPNKKTGLKGDLPCFPLFPLLSLVKENKIKWVRLLLKYNVDVNEISDTGYTPLMVAAKNGHTDILIDLLKAGADIYIKNDNKLAIDYAKENGHKKIVKILDDYHKKYIEKIDSELILKEKSGYLPEDISNVVKSYII